MFLLGQNPAPPPANNGDLLDMFGSNFLPNLRTFIPFDIHIYIVEKWWSFKCQNPNHYINNGCVSEHPLKKWLALGYQDVPGISSNRVPWSRRLSDSLLEADMNRTHWDAQRQHLRDGHGFIIELQGRWTRITNPTKWILWILIYTMVIQVEDKKSTTTEGYLWSFSWVPQASQSSEGRRGSLQAWPSLES